MSTARPRTKVARYRQVKQAIVALLRAGKWAQGRAIPSEPLLARRFLCSVGTLRKAIGELVNDNVLVREQGRGTFVISHSTDYMLDAFFQLVDGRRRKAMPRVQLLAFAHGRADAQTAERLGIARGRAVLQLRHLLHLDGRPTIVDDIRLPAARFRGLQARELSERGETLYAFLQQRFDVTVVRVLEHLDAVGAPDDVARLLGVPPGHPLLHVVRTGFSLGGQATDTRHRWIRTGERRYESSLGQRTP